MEEKEGRVKIDETERVCCRDDEKGEQRKRDATKKKRRRKMSGVILTPHIKELSMYF